MLIDARERPDEPVEADIVIIGGGAAGISLACELAGPGLTVALLESGGLTPEADIQELNAGESVGLDGPALSASRLRFLGGTTNHWTGQCAPLDPIDFEARDWVPHSGWPLTRADLDPFYERASVYCQLGPHDGYDAIAIREAMGVPALGFSPDDFEPLVYQMSPPTRFGEAWREWLETAPGLDVYLYANVIELVPTENGDRIAHVSCGTLTGRRFPAIGRSYVLATGGIENARVLLASNSVVRAGLGNRHDLVGRFFMDHYNVQGAGRLVFARPDRVDGRFHGYWGHAGVRGRGGLRVSPARLREERILNAAILLWPEPANENHRDVPRTAGVDAFVSVAQSLATRQLPDDFWRETCLAVNGRRDVASFVKRRVLRRVQDPGGVLQASLQLESEQAPNPDSRVTLAGDRDAFGVPRARLDWRVSDVDLDSIRRTLELFGLAAGSSDVGRYRAEFAIESDEPPVLTSTFHHVGTTRMGTSPTESVVNADCRLHEVDNLYITGSSVFPTAGRSNPTLTLVALAIRLADHLRETTRRAGRPGLEATWA